MHTAPENDQFIENVGWVCCLPWLLWPLQAPPGLWLFTLLRAGAEWGADRGKLHPFSPPPPPCLTGPAQITQPRPLQLPPCTSSRLPETRQEARTFGRSGGLCLPTCVMGWGSLQHRLPWAGVGGATLLRRGRPSPEVPERAGPDTSFPPFPLRWAPDAGQARLDGAPFLKGPGAFSAPAPRRWLAPPLQLRE